MIASGGRPPALRWELPAERGAARRVAGSWTIRNRLEST